MTIERLFEPLALPRGQAMKNRFLLAPLTNSQSHAGGQLSDAEIRWLTMRAAGGFGLVMTAAAHVQAVGQGFPGQLGIFGDDQLPGLAQLAAELRAHGARSSVQLHHAGARADRDLVGQPVAPSAEEASGARALTLDEVERLRDDFIAAAARAERSGFDGVEIHGAHGYVVAQFLSAESNRREDRYGGSLENRSRLLFEIIAGIRAVVGPDFQLGVRLSPERYGQKLMEIREIAARLMREDQIDYLDLSLWDVRKEPVEAEFQGRSLLSWFTDLPRGRTRLGAAGKILRPQEAVAALEAGCDFVVLGRAGILHHDYPRRLHSDADFAPIATPVSADHLAAEGLSPVFVDYMRNWKGFVAEAADAAE